MTNPTSIPQKRRALFSRLKSDKSGIAMVEFALALPLLSALSIGGMELTNFSAAKMRASQIALMVADNAGRVRVSIDETDIDEVMIGARVEGEVMNFGARGRVILSSLEHNGKSGADEGQTIRWQRCFGAKQVNSTFGLAGDGIDSSSLAAGMGPPGKKIKALTNMVVMYVELVYDYKPIVSQSILGPQLITSTAAYIVRERANQTVTNSVPLPVDQWRTCDIYKAT
jgi:Flp pilus assembly pilin Flp